MTNWKRYRFISTSEDYRPIKFPPPGPWWCSGYDGNDNAVIISYLPAEADLTEYWPEATGIEFTEEDEIRFTSRFQKPEWWD